MELDNFCESGDEEGCGDAQNTPLPGIVIAILDLNGVSINSTEQIKTNKNGEASVSVPPGQWTIVPAVKLDYIEKKGSSSNIIVAEREKTHRLTYIYKKTTTGIFLKFELQKKLFFFIQ